MNVVKGLIEYGAQGELPHPIFSSVSLYSTPHAIDARQICNGYKFYYQPTPTPRKRKFEEDSLRTLSRQHHTFRPQAPNWFETLPTEIVRHVLYFVDMDDLGRVGSVCWKFERICLDEALWLHHCCFLWKNRPERDPYFKEHPMSWRKLALVRRSIEVEYFCEKNRHVPPVDSQMFLKWGDFLCKEASGLIRSDNNRADWLFFVAMQEYDSVVTISNPECFEVYIHWGDALSDVALTKSGWQQEELFRMSQEKFQMARGIMYLTTNMMDTDNLKLGSVDLSLFGINSEC